ncbi:MAG: 50S ribosomal protein L11 methyltransferase [Solirubrobacteraceae bacterium]
MVRLGVRVRREEAEVVLAELLELAPGGVEEVELPGNLVEYAVYGAPGELPALPALQAAAGGALVEVRSEEVAGDWSRRWRQFHRPLVIDDRLTVRPPWEPPGTTSIDLVIEPGQAFGTGAHATTRLCLELMLELPAGGPFLDLGCGSGVLAIAAAKLGFSPVRGLDNDSVALDVARDNAAANRVEVELARHDLREALPPQAPTVAANLLSPLLTAWASGLERARDHRPERILASGILVAETDAVASAFARAGLGEVRRARHGDWTALLLGRPVP